MQIVCATSKLHKVQSRYRISIWQKCYPENAETIREIFAGWRGKIWVIRSGTTVDSSSQPHPAKTFGDVFYMVLRAPISDANVKLYQPQHFKECCIWKASRRISDSRTPSAQRRLGSKSDRYTRHSWAKTSVITVYLLHIWRRSWCLCTCALSERMGLRQKKTGTFENWSLSIND